MELSNMMSDAAPRQSPLALCRSDSSSFSTVRKLDLVVTPIDQFYSFSNKLNDKKIQLPPLHHASNVTLPSIREILPDIHRDAAFFDDKSSLSSASASPSSYSLSSSSCFPLRPPSLISSRPHSTSSASSHSLISSPISRSPSVSSMDFFDHGYHNNTHKGPFPGPSRLNSYRVSKKLPGTSSFGNISPATACSHTLSSLIHNKDEPDSPSSVSSAKYEGNSDSDSGSSSSSKKKRYNLPKKTTTILLKWLEQNLHHPYPTNMEKQQLMFETGLNAQQLGNWFINARRRKVGGMKEAR
ncbi:hypothetical protein BABINDRAFT_159330 [Babjeviella inositovora NRRL Y-12698]|uniref:Homeobox domain-containing protein n=1 Tax=Babjeviella inositovora NRRL Y-12698 TaxID=984486 RepID=A0A1E3QYT2_9ASCO|nr:uncharacterized protein BABINDRAFT_159330 [Babjeviella inositovora NRRL Y-12698]ODQ82830.1 hypothetical protein BABINDRAFT_159330 [Babjeviella inositovora NRRL Y-12698]